MATVIGDAKDIRLEFTALELDLMREIGFNTGKSLDRIAAERLSQGIICDQPGENADYELRYTPDTQDDLPRISLENSEKDEDLRLRRRLEGILIELYNVAWTRGVNEVTGSVNEEDRKLHVDIRIDMIMHEVYDCES